jgi:hypothetical protein
MRVKDSSSWETALFTLLHPLQIGTMEAMVWIDEPLSATVLVEIFCSDVPLSNVSYHLSRLVKGGVLREVSTRKVRGAFEHFYALID